MPVEGTQGQDGQDRSESRFHIICCFLVALFCGPLPLLPRRSRRRVLPQAEIKVIQAKSRPEHFSCAAVPKHRRSPGYFLFLLFLVLVLRYALVTPCVTP